MPLYYILILGFMGIYISSSGSSRQRRSKRWTVNYTECMDELSWKVVFYETIRGDSPVYKFFIRQQPKAQSKITHLVDLLSRYGNMLGLPHSKALSGGLYELRIRGREEIRIFYCFTQQRTIYLLMLRNHVTNFSFCNSTILALRA